MWHIALPIADTALAAKLKSQLEVSSDAGLVRATGEFWSESRFAWGKWPDARCGESAACSKELLERARQGVRRRYCFADALAPRCKREDKKPRHVSGSLLYSPCFRCPLPAMM